MPYVHELTFKTGIYYTHAQFFEFFSARREPFVSIRDYFDEIFKLPEAEGKCVDRRLVETRWPSVANAFAYLSYLQYRGVTRAGLKASGDDLAQRLRYLRFDANPEYYLPYRFTFFQRKLSERYRYTDPEKNTGGLNVSAIALRWYLADKLSAATDDTKQQRLIDKFAGLFTYYDPYISELYPLGRGMSARISTDSLFAEIADFRGNDRIPLSFVYKLPTQDGNFLLAGFVKADDQLKVVGLPRLVILDHNDCTQLCQLGQILGKNLNGSQENTAQVSSIRQENRLPLPLPASFEAAFLSFLKPNETAQALERIILKIVGNRPQIAASIGLVDRDGQPRFADTATAASFVVPLLLHAQKNKLLPVGNFMPGLFEYSGKLPM